MESVVKMAEDILKNNLKKNLGEEAENHFERNDISKPNSKFDELYERGIGIHRNWKDYNSSANNMIFQNVNDTLYLIDKEASYIEPLTNWSLTQFATKNDIPAGYIKKCLQYGKVDLSVNNLNDWLTTNNKNEYFVRTYNDRIRGILSKRFTPFDNYEILEIIKNNLPNNFVVESSFLDSDDMNIRFVDSSKTYNIGGDNLKMGLVIKNSNIGGGNVEAKFLLYRLICSNGMIIGGKGVEDYKHKHIGISKNDFHTYFYNLVNSIPIFANKLETKIQESMNHKIDMNDLEKLIDKFKIGLKPSEPIVQKIINENAIQKTETLWDFVNSITRVSQDYDIQTQERMEEHAGKVLMAA